MGRAPLGFWTARTPGRAHVPSARLTRDDVTDRDDAELPVRQRAGVLHLLRTPPRRAGRDDGRAADAVAVLRLRLGRTDYVFRTWHPRTRPDDVENDTTLTWTASRCSATQDGGVDDLTGIVEFRARYRTPVGAGAMHETSRFERWAGPLGVRRRGRRPDGLTRGCTLRRESPGRVRQSRRAARARLAGWAGVPPPESPGGRGRGRTRCAVVVRSGSCRWCGPGGESSVEAVGHPVQPVGEGVPAVRLVRAGDAGPPGGGDALGDLLGGELSG